MTAKKLTTNQLMSRFMKNLEEQNVFTDEELTIIYENLSDIVISAQEKVIEDAERQIAKLRTFSLNR